MTNSITPQITVDGTIYVPKGSAVQAAPPNGNRAVVVVDRGWIFAGDVIEKNGRIKLTRAVWVFRWEGVGFDGMIKDPKSPKVTLRTLDTGVDIPADSEIFRTPVSDSWGL